MGMCVYARVDLLPITLHNSNWTVKPPTNNVAEPALREAGRRIKGTIILYADKSLLLYFNENRNNNNSISLDVVVAIVRRTGTHASFDGRFSCAPP